MIEEEWVDVGAGIVAVLDREAHRLRDMDSSLIWQASGASLVTGGLSCWLTVSHRGAVDPHMEVTVTLTGRPAALVEHEDLLTSLAV